VTAETDDSAPEIGRPTYSADDEQLRIGIQEELERTLLGGRRRFNRYQAAEEAGVPLERATRLWVAMGFAQGEDTEAVMYTRGDVQALRTIGRLVEEGVITSEMEVSGTRALGQSLSRLAEWQVGLMTNFIGTRVAEVTAQNPEGDPLDVDAVRAEVSGMAKGLLPTIEALQSYVWRRHLAANAGRALFGPGEGVPAASGGGIRGHRRVHQPHQAAGHRRAGQVDRAVRVHRDGHHRRGPRVGGQDGGR
jgi:adenylate cyclase